MRKQINLLFACMAVTAAVIAIALMTSCAPSYIRYQHHTRSSSPMFSQRDTVKQRRSMFSDTTRLLGRINEPYYIYLVLDSVDPTGTKQRLWYAHDLRGVGYDRVSEVSISKL